MPDKAYHMTIDTHWITWILEFNSTTAGKDQQRLYFFAHVAFTIQVIMAGAVSFLTVKVDLRSVRVHWDW